MRKVPNALLVAGCLVASLGLALAARGDAPAPAGSVSFLSGEASRTAGGTSVKLALGSLVYPGDEIATAPRTRLEVRLADQSALRLGPNSRMRLAAASFGKTPEDRQVSAKLMVGNIWAQVTHVVGGESKFEVQTENAVAGVRGTTFRVDARRDRSCVVKVYAGAVAVAGNVLPRPGHAVPGEEGGRDGGRVQVPGPQEITREQWEKRVESMMQVRISAKGEPSEVESFALSRPGEDDWEQWNRNRDRGT